MYLCVKFNDFIVLCDQVLYGFAVTKIYRVTTCNWNTTRQNGGKVEFFSEVK